MGGQELAGGCYEQASVRTTVWEAASSLLGRAVATPAQFWERKFSGLTETRWVT